MMSVRDDLFCKDRKCPICQSPVKFEVPMMHGKIPYKNKDKIGKKSRVVDITCSNSCYKLITNFSWFHSGKFYRCNMFLVFDKIFMLHNIDRRKQKKEIEKEIRKSIEYYKKDFRYVAEILENC